ncbi:MAG: diguanylate cyclase [Thiomicrospira sp.]|uniref:diguanylate cyclase n=1 Tax=Thiomicrospira sp. TaxID=935 RepID=UPI0019DE6882|nr:diguanylate cyclase [Thiomicrospira sp.]MBE0493177.1 diguanylate cyclase [Thiomicrospira sp.]
MQTHMSNFAITHSQAWLTAMFENAASAVFVFDTQAKLLACNPACCDLLDRSCDQLVGLELRLLKDSRVSQAVEQVLQGESVSLELDYQFTLNDRRLPLSFEFHPVRDRGELLGGIGLIENLSEKQEALSSNQRQIEFEKLVANISKRLVNASSDELDQTIDLVMAQLGHFFDVDRCYVFQYDSAGIEFSNTHEWCAESIESKMAVRQNLARSDFPWIHTQIMMQRPVNIPSVADLEDSVASERDVLLAQGVQSLLAIPMIEHGKLVGLLGIDSVRQPYTWVQDKITLLEVVAESISNALMRRSFEQALSRINQQYQQFSSQVPLGLYTLRVDAEQQAHYEYCNKQFLAMNGVNSAADLLNRKPIHPDDLADFQERQQFAWKAHKAFVWEGRYFLDDKVRWMRMEDSEPTQAENGDWIWSGFQQDITDRKQLEERLKELATVDDMTQLWNRRYFMLACDEEFERAQRYDNQFSFLMLDADHFKSVNDNYGHAAGDAVLVNLAKVLSDSVRKVDVVGRLGGEEFAILLPNTPESEAQLLAERIRHSVENYPADYKGQTLPITISIGISSYRSNDQDLDQVIQRADKALYQAKNQGRNRCVVAS